MAPDPITDAIESAEHKAKEEPEGVPAIAQVVLTMLPDGGIHFTSTPGIKPPVLWAMGRFLDAVGNDMFRSAVDERRSAKAAVDPRRRLVVPGGTVRE